MELPEKEYSLDFDVTISRFLAKKGKKMRSKSSLFKYKKTGESKQLDFRCGAFETVLDVFVEVGEVKKGTVILKTSVGCLHPIRAFGMCGDCGKDLKDDDEVSDNVVSMLHATPQVSVTLNEAAELGKSDIINQLKKRKLTLVVDLDQTIIHTSTTEHVPEGIPGVFHFTLSNKNFRYSTRLRPGTEAFLEEMSRLYEMHVFTMGARDYANTITHRIDPQGKYFSHRILSRDECFDSHSKAPKLKALFPKGDNLVVIIDDRFDMWVNCPNLIRVRPYNFFEDVGDINDPNGYAGNKKGPPCNGSNPVATFSKNKPLTMQQSDFCFQTGQNNIACSEHVPLANSTIDYNQVYSNLKNFLDDGNFELSLLHIRAVCAKLKKIEHVELINKDWADKAGKKEGEKKVAEEDNKEVNKGESMEESMDCEEEKGGDSEEKQDYGKKGDEGEKDSNKKKVDSKDKKVEKDEKDEGKKEEVTDKTKEVILKICKAGDVAKALSQFYMEFIENGADRAEEREQLLLTSPLYQYYQSKARDDQDDYLVYLKEILGKIHKSFYDDYDKRGLSPANIDDLPDTKALMPDVRGVLKNAHIVFSGIIPTNHNQPQNHPAWKAAHQMGASMSLALVKSGDKKTTHLITSRSDTGKAHQAGRMGIKIVTEEWLWACFERWEKVPTDVYEWKGLSNRKRSKSPVEEVVLESELMQSMRDEVEEVLGTASGSDYSSPSDSDNSGDEGAESLDSNDLSGPDDSPNKRKRSRSPSRERESSEEELLLDPLLGNKPINEEEDDYVSDNSIEADLMSALEAELN